MAKACSVRQHTKKDKTEDVMSRDQIIVDPINHLEHRSSRLRPVGTTRESDDLVSLERDQEEAEWKFLKKTIGEEVKGEKSMLLRKF